MTETLLLRNGRIIDPAHNVDETADLLVRDGVVAERGRGLQPSGDVREIDCRDLVVAPGLIDLHAHLREPGHEYKEDIASGARAAVAGGFTAVCAMPNTNPVNDTRSVTEFMVRRAAEANLCHVHPIGAISKGLRGESLADIGDMVHAGAVAISDDGRCVMNAALMRRALEYAQSFDVPVVQHAEDHNLSQGTCVTEGEMATRAGLSGQPVQAEDVIVLRDVALVELTGARYHVAHLSTAGAADAVRRAKTAGLPVTCEVTPHHFTLTDEATMEYNTSTRVNPPLRPAAHRDAILEALADGTVDAIATDHAPHSELEKEVEFDCAAPGMLGLETALPLSLQLVRDGVLPLSALLAKLTCGPAQVFGLRGGHLAVGAPADIVCIDMDRERVLQDDSFVSKSRNSPFLGWTLRGLAAYTIVGGRVAYSS